MKRIRYSRNLSDTCLVNVYRDTYEGTRLISQRHVLTVEYLNGESVKLAKKIVRLLNKEGRK